MEDVRTYKVEIERDGRGWVASVPSVPGAHTQGRTIDQARRRIREALGLWVTNADRANLRFEVKLPATTRRQVERAIALRGEADRKNRDAAAALRRTVERLTEQGFSRRDAGELLGISRQRAQQLTEIEDHEAVGA